MQKKTSYHKRIVRINLKGNGNQANFETERNEQEAEDKDFEWRLKNDPAERHRVSLLFGGRGRSPEIIAKFLRESVPEVDRIYKWIAPISEIEERKIRALKKFNSHRADFHLVRRDMLQDLSIYKLPGNALKAVFREKLLSKLIDHWLEHKINSRSLRKLIGKVLH